MTRWIRLLGVAALISAAPVVATGADDMKEKLAGYYEPVFVPEFKPSVPATSLPLALEKLANWAEAQRVVPDAARGALGTNGFAVIERRGEDRVEQFYDSCKKLGLPIFITSDSLLHLYHVQFDETLRQIEETKFYGDLLALTDALRKDCEEVVKAVPPKAKGSHMFASNVSAEQLALEYFTVAARLLDEKALIDPAVAKDVQAEIDLIEQHAGFAESPLFKYKEDYSQYVPRGHYTRSEKLKRYFKAMMWYGRMAFLVKGTTLQIKDALISDDEAHVQTLAAFYIYLWLRRVSLADGRKAADVWRTLYAVSAYYVGFADDLTPQEYGEVFESFWSQPEKMFGDVIQKRWLGLQKALAQTRAPEIYGGTGEIAGPPPQVATEADLDKALAATTGMRFMGQRYVPDSYILGRLVYPTVGKFTGQGAPFTLVQSQAGPIRGFPRGLDVMAVLGASRAKEVLRLLGDDAFERYGEEAAKLGNRFGAIPEKDWNRNIYWSWLNALRALLPPSPEGYPTFMRTIAWQDKQLNAALGSWAQLRHDTILYAKQSYTMLAMGMPRRPKMVEGYVEPVPQFYARLLALTRMTLKGLDDLKVLDDQSRGRLKSLDGILTRLLDISVRELQNRQLEAEDYDFIRSFGENLKSAVAGADTQGLETEIVADVHTDANSGRVLEEGTGCLNAIAVAYPMPDGGVVLGLGPVFTYYEFKQPMANRLTDEAWRALLRSPDAPKPMRW